VLIVPDSNNHPCPLCNSTSKVFYQYKKRLYHQCDNCFGIFVDNSLILDRNAEKLRYEEHNNDVNDANYQQFVSPITDAILSKHNKSDQGLDFGAGTGPVIAKVLGDNNYNISLYDPFFQNQPELLEDKYDYIACCEVIEHFHEPYKEFGLLKRLLKKGALLYCMTDLYNEDVDFHKWYYKNDPTHVFIYPKKTIHWLQKEFAFFNVTIAGRLITFSN
jgi:SAM-dependent methyltransferase